MLVVRSLLSVFLLFALSHAQAPTSVSVKQIGTDAVGQLLKQSVEKKFGQSGIPVSVSAKQAFRHFVELVTLDADPAKPGQSSFVSIVIRSNVPNGWPIPDQWYHKVLIVQRAQVDSVAAQLFDDLFASWCNTSKNSLSPCPAETSWPGVPQNVPERPVAKP